MPYVTNVQIIDIDKSVLFYICNHFFQECWYSSALSFRSLQLRNDKK